MGYLPAGRSLRDAFALGGRIVVARGMSFLTLVVAAWLVDIQAFAEFGVYQTLATLAGIALFLRYDAAIVAAGATDEARKILHLCIVIGAVLWLCFTSMSVGAGMLGWIRGELALLLPLAILARGLLRLCYARTTAEGDFAGLGRSILIQAVIQPVALLVLVLSPIEDVLSFAFADVIGHGSAVLYLFWRRREHLAVLFQGWSRSAMLAVARSWSSLPLYNLPGAFFSLAFVMSPLLIIPMAGDAVIAGHAALAYRIFDVPTQILSASAIPIFLNWRPSHDRRTPIFGRSTLVLLIVLVGIAYAGMAGVLILIDPYLESTALAGLVDVVPLMALFHLFVALAAPLNESCTLYPQQRRLVVIQGLALAGCIVAAFVTMAVSPQAGLATLACVGALRLLATGELLRVLSGNSHRSYASAPA